MHALFYDLQPKFSFVLIFKNGISSLCCYTCCFLILQSKVNTKARKHKLWMRNFFTSKKTSLLRELKEDYLVILEILMPKIEKQNINMREVNPADTRLAITLRFLATGDLYASLMYLFNISTPNIYRIISKLRDYIKVLSIFILLFNRWGSGVWK